MLLAVQQKESWSSVAIERMSLPLEVLVAIIIITSFFIIAVITFTVCYLAKKRRGKKRYRVMIPVLDLNHSQSNEKKTYYPKDSKGKSRRHGAYQQIHDPKYAVHDSPDELDESDYHSESDAAEKAKKMNGNLLRTSKGKVMVHQLCIKFLLYFSIRFIPVLLKALMQ